MDTPHQDAPSAGPAPGFYLIDDAEGRFVVDREFGFVSLADESMLEHEAGAIHAATLRVIEASGESYDLSLRLRLSGRIPQMVGGEENDFLLDLAAASVSAAPSPPAPAKPEIAPVPVPWPAFAAARGGALASLAAHEHAPWGALIVYATTYAEVSDAQLRLPAAPPAPAGPTATWIV